MQQNTVFPSLERILRLQDAHALTKRSDLCRVRAAGMMRPGMHVFERCTKPTERSARSGLKPDHAFTGSDQARKGRLVNALAIRGDEGRGTLR